MALKITGTNTAAAPGITGDDTDTGLFYDSDVLGFSTGGTERLRIAASGQIGIAGTNYGSSGQVLTSAGSGGSVTWSTPSSGTTLSGSTNNTICTVTGANAIAGEANLTFDGSDLTLQGQYFYIKAPDGGNRYFFGETQNDKSAQLSLYNSADAQKVRIAAGDGAGDGDTFFNGGKVGIGRSNPGHLLHLQSSNTDDYVANTATNNTMLMLANSGTVGANHCVSLGFNGTSTNGEGYISLVAEDTSNSDLRFSLRRGGSRQDVFTMHSNGDITVPSGSIKLSESGQGINFHAHGTGSGVDSNLLADYEEGTFDAVVSVASGTGSYSYRTLKYIKIGKKVTIMGLLDMSVSVTDPGRFDIGGMPFAMSTLANQYVGFMCPAYNTNASTGCNGGTRRFGMAAGANYFRMYNGGFTSDGELGTTGRVKFHISVSYPTDS